LLHADRQVADFQAAGTVEWSGRGRSRGDHQTARAAPRNCSGAALARLVVPDRRRDGGRSALPPPTCPRETIAAERGAGRPARSGAPLVLRASLARTIRRVRVLTMTPELSQH
jgi:hypothetical protein